MNNKLQYWIELNCVKLFYKNLQNKNISAICPPSSGLFDKIEAFGLDSQETQKVNLKTVKW
jgi:hypothetical protein